jgi:hypothetical protein
LKKDLRWDIGLFRLKETSWHLLLTKAYELDRLDKVLEINISKPEDEEENKYAINYEQTKKLRLFLRILFTSVKYYKTNIVELENKGVSVTAIIKKIEDCIVKYVCGNLKLKGESQVYLFDYSLDSFKNNKDSSFINEFAEILNFLGITSKKEVLNTMLTTRQSLEKLLVLFNNLESEGARKLLKDEINKISSEEFLRTVSWLPEIETGLIEALNSNIFTDLADTLLSYYEKQINAKDKMYVNDKLALIFRLKLFVAYRNRNIEDIEKLEVPNDSSNNFNYTELNNQKIFFKALLLQENLSFSKALHLFDNLVKVEPKNFEFILRRLILKCDMAQEEQSKDNSNGIAEIQKINSGINEVEQEIIDHKSENPGIYVNHYLIKYIKSFCYVNLGMYVDFDNLYYNSLTSVEQLNEGFLDLAIERCIHGSLDNEAYSLYIKALDFHKLPRDKEPEFLQKIHRKIRNADIEPNIGQLFRFLHMQAYEKRINAIPEIVNPFNKHLGEFLLYEICEAAKDLLEKVNTVQKLISTNEKLKASNKSLLQKNFSENEITDLLEVIFKGRINYLDLKLQIQPRKGGGGDGTGMGMPDSAIPLDLKQVIIEAVRVYSTDSENDSKTRIVEHIEKTFNYSTSKYAFFNVVYYEKTDFNEGWEFFKNTIIKSCNFEDEYSLDEEFVDLSEKIGNDAINTGVTKHKSGLLFYHIYLNFRYIINKAP